MTIIPCQSWGYIPEKFHVDNAGSNGKFGIMKNWPL
jgi:hypothetical protein